MKFCNNTNFTLPKLFHTSRSVLEDGSRSLGLFWKEKSPSYNRRNTVPSSNPARSIIFVSVDSFWFVVYVHAVCKQQRFCRSENINLEDLNPIALRKAIFVCNFGLSECNRVKQVITLCEIYGGKFWPVT